MKVDGLSGNTEFERRSTMMNDIFEFAKKNNVAIFVEYLPAIDAYKVCIKDTGSGMDILLDGLMLDTKPEFREKALDYCLERYITRRILKI